MRWDGGSRTKFGKPSRVTIMEYTVSRAIGFPCRIPHTDTMPSYRYNDLKKCEKKLV